MTRVKVRDGRMNDRNATQRRRMFTSYPSLFSLIHNRQRRATEGHYRHALCVSDTANVTQLRDEAANIKQRGIMIQCDLDAFVVT